MKVPRDWNTPAHDHWNGGRRQEAINVVLAELNNPAGRGPGPYLQLGYYLAIIGDYPTAAVFLAQGANDHPDNSEIALNLGICRAKSGDFAGTVEALLRYRSLGGQNPAAFDALAKAYYKLGRFDQAREAGERSLDAKDRAASGAMTSTSFEVPDDAAAKPRIIAFTLFGSAARYLRGALQNALLAPKLYPGWTCRFYIDETVPPDLVEALQTAGAEVTMRSSAEPLHRRLCWRFEVADDADVGFFIVRDCDSVISERETLAVEDWLASGKPFHVMRDWWTHTDAILAGMWGGTARVLPSMTEMIDTYSAGRMVTANWDQWLLGARVWPLIRNSAMVHDRLFDSYSARPFPGETPPGNRHVGQNEFAIRPAEQTAALDEWRERAPSLRL